MMSYPRALQIAIVFLFTVSIAACSGGSGGSAYQDVMGEGNGGSGDNNGLTVTIATPDAPEIDTTDHTMDLSGKAQSPAGITSVGWTTNRGSKGTANGTESWSISDIPLELGANKITVTAIDSAGQSHSDKIIIHRESGGTGTVTLSWVAPTERTDGTPLDNLAGYKISFGRMSKVYDYTVTIDNPGLATYVVENLMPGSWYFAIAAYDAEGLVSDFSNEARRRVD